MWFPGSTPCRAAAAAVGRGTLGSISCQPGLTRSSKPGLISLKEPDEVTFLPHLIGGLREPRMPEHTVDLGAHGRGSCGNAGKGGCLPARAVAGGCLLCRVTCSRGPCFQTTASSLSLPGLRGTFLPFVLAYAGSAACKAITSLPPPPNLALAVCSRFIFKS